MCVFPWEIIRCVWVAQRPSWCSHLRGSLGKSHMLMGFATVILMLAWLISENVCNSWEVLKLFETDESTVCFEENFDRDFWRESLCENANNASEQPSTRIPVIATFEENPCARMQKMYPANGRPGPLSSPLLQRILVRKWKLQKCKNWHLDFCRESLDETHNNKRPGLGGDGFPCI